MLLKSIIFQQRGNVREKDAELSYSLGSCISIAADNLNVITTDERALLATIKQDRDCAAHDMISMSEQLMWVRMRASITVMRRLLKDELGINLTDRVPGRVIPVSTEAPKDLRALVKMS